MLNLINALKTTCAVKIKADKKRKFRNERGPAIRKSELMNVIKMIFVCTNVYCINK